MENDVFVKYEIASVILIFIIGIVSEFILIWRSINDSPTLEQAKCDHNWQLVKKNKDECVIYCPKCKLEKYISDIKWEEMKIDKEFQEQNNG